MAEIGTAASIIAVVSIAIQVGDSVIKLKKFCESIKDAPEEVTSLIEEIEVLSLVLADIGSGDDTSDLQIARSASTERCLDLCQKAQKSLKDILEGLQAQMGKGKKIGAFKVVMKKDVIQRLKERLGSAQMMLLLSHQFYTAALQQAQYRRQQQWAEQQQCHTKDLQISMSQMTELVVSPRIAHIPHYHDGSQDWRNKIMTESRPATSRKTREDRLKLIARIWFPRLSWTRRLAVEVSGSKAPSGWMFNIRTYNIVPLDSPAIECISGGDLDGLKVLLQQGKASIYDLANDQTLLMHAIQHRRYDMCDFLLESGVELDDCPQTVLVSLLWIWHYYSIPTEDDEDKRILLSSYFKVWHRCQEPKFWRSMDASKFQHSKMTRQALLLFESQSLSGLMTFCVSLLMNIWPAPNATSFIEFIFQGVAIGEMAISIVGDGFAKGGTLIHCLAANFPTTFDITIFGRWNHFRRNCYDEKQLGLKTLMKRLLHAGASLHAIYFEGELCSQCFTEYRFHQTPLLSLLSSSYLPWKLKLHPSKDQKFTTVLVSAFAWLHYLEDSGVDLLEYGQREKKLQNQGMVNKSFPSRWLYHRGKYGIGHCQPWLRLISFQYGPRPSDWRFWFTEDATSAPAQFWNMVENPEQFMPGTWVDEDKCDYEGEC